MKLNQTAKPIMIIIEGVDRTGKDTLQQTLNKATDYKNMVMIRGPIGFLAYNLLYDKGVDPQDYLELEKSYLNVPHLCVYLTADTDELLQRFIDTNEEPLREESKPLSSRRDILVRHKAVHEIFYERSKLNKMIIDTTNLSTEEVAKKVVEEINFLHGPLKARSFFKDSNGITITSDSPYISISPLATK